MNVRSTVKTPHAQSDVKALKQDQRETWFIVWILNISLSSHAMVLVASPIGSISGKWGLLFLIGFYLHRKVGSHFFCQSFSSITPGPFCLIKKIKKSPLSGRQLIEFDIDLHGLTSIFRESHMKSDCNINYECYSVFKKKKRLDHVLNHFGVSLSMFPVSYVTLVSPRPRPCVKEEPYQCCWPHLFDKLTALA